jgi:DNA polymerase I
MTKIEMPLILVLSEMELNGVAVDKQKLVELSARIRLQLAEITKRVYEMAGEEFNIASPLQLREVLFEKMNIPVEGVKKGKTGLSTSAEQLEKLRDQHPIIEQIENFRELTKLQNTYSDVLPTLINPRTGRIHTHFNQTIAATGRLSSTDPNLQNIPVRTELGREIRKAFVAEPGNVLLSADYSQIELRIVASLAEDKKMMEIFAADLDIHSATAAAINGVPLEEVTREMRYAAKEVNFGVLYGMGTHGLSWRAKIPYWQAKEFIDTYFREFSGVKKYIDQTLEFTRKEGYCETLFGRRRYLPELSTTNFQARSAAERMAINHPIQGTAADLMKLAMIAVHQKIQVSNCKLFTKMMLQVHDELVLEVQAGLEKEVGQLLKETMEQVVTLRVPVKVEVKAGQNWGELKKI